MDVDVHSEKHPLTEDVAVTAICKCHNRYRQVIVNAEELLNCADPVDVVKLAKDHVAKKLQQDHEGLL